ncbi:hypothetical protein AB0454_40610 [Streptomyces sp. NPDC093509]|uniref:hypothetical protein n=1 Tax=Streptomyces sp. NPDC093509 TaxID=3154982 RepID=UPI00344B197A
MIVLSKPHIDEAYRQALVKAHACGAFKDSTPRCGSVVMTSDRQRYRVGMVSPTDGEVTTFIRAVDVQQAVGPQHIVVLQSPMTQPAGEATDRAQSVGRLLRGAVRLLPSAEREDWLEEQQGYLADLPSRRARWMWTLSQLAAMPRYAYTVRTGREKEPA